MFFNFRHRLSQAALIKAELGNLAAWAERTWPEYWADNFGQNALEETLDQFLPDGLDHARSIVILNETRNSVIARALVAGVIKSGTHPASQIANTLGVPIPSEAQK